MVDNNPVSEELLGVGVAIGSVPKMIVPGV